MSTPNTDPPSLDREMELEAAAAMLAFVVLMTPGDVRGDLDLQERLKALADSFTLESADGQRVIPDSRAFHAAAKGLAELLRERAEQGQGRLTEH